MTEANYSVVRYVPDPARSEALNIGILAWTSNVVRLSIDDQAVARVVRENPHLERDALFYVEALLSEHLGGSGPVPAKVHSLLSDQTGFPVLLTEPRATHLRAGDLPETVERLLSRIVRPRRRSGGGGGNPADVLARQLRPLLDRRVVRRNYSISGSVSGIPRTVDFFANGGANIALDVVRLGVSQAEEIRKRSDAEAFKVWDVLSGGLVATFVAFCSFSQDDGLVETNANAKAAIQAAGAEIVTVVDEAVTALDVEETL